MSETVEIETPYHELDRVLAGPVVLQLVDELPRRLGRLGRAEDPSAQRPECPDRGLSGHDPSAQRHQLPRIGPQSGECHGHLANQDILADTVGSGDGPKMLHGMHASTLQR